MGMVHPEIVILKMTFQRSSTGNNVYEIVLEVHGLVVISMHV